MSKWPEDFEQHVLNDIEKYKNIRKIKKAGLIERYAVKYCSPDKIHPNPEDEFTHDDVGPNFEIVGNYTKDIKNAFLHDLEIFDEPLEVEKMEPDGYMLLNGHHRWFAAIRMGVQKIHIHIVNMIKEEDLHKMIAKSANSMRVSFDLDEVLMTDSESDQAELSSQIFSRRIKERLRAGAPEVIRGFQDKGFDVWVYTSGYNSEEYIKDFFYMYGLEIDGIVNGVNEKRRARVEEVNRIREMMAQKYKTSVHVDNESVVFVNTRDDKYFEQYEILDYSEDWESGILNILDKEILNKLG